MEKKQTGIVTGGKLNLREQPTTQSKSLALIPDGEKTVWRGICAVGFMLSI